MYLFFINNKQNYLNDTSNISILYSLEKYLETNFDIFIGMTFIYKYQTGKY